MTNSTKITDIKPVSKTENEFKNYATLENTNGTYYLTIKRAVNSQLFLNVTISGAASSITLYIKTSDVYTGENAWLNNYTTQKDDKLHTIKLLSYGLLNTLEENEETKNIKIPKSVKINGTEYTIEISGSVYKGATSIKSVVFEKGVKADTSIASLFAGDKNLTSVDLSGLNTENTTDMSAMFFNCSSLNDSSITFSNGENTLFTTKNVTDMSTMFSGMTSLTELDLSSFNTTNLKNIELMFSGDTALTKVNLSSFRGAPSQKLYSYYHGAREDDIKNYVAPFNAPLAGCSNIKTIVLGSTWQGFSIDNSKQVIYLPLGIYDSWQNTTNLKIYTSEQLDYSFDGNTMAGTYNKVNMAGADPQYEANGSLYGKNIWEVHNSSQAFHGFCLNEGKHFPKGYYDKVRINTNASQQTSNENGYSDYIGDYISADSGSEYIGGTNPTMAKALIALIYYSENPIDAQGNKLTETEAQQLIWLFTDHYSYISDKDYSFTSNSLRYTYSHETHTFHFYDVNSGKEKYSFNLEKYNYDSIKSNYKLFIYSPSSDNTLDVQNLLSIEGATTDVRAGVQVKKVDQHGNPVVGAKFNVYKKGEVAEGKEIASFVTLDSGYGGLYGMDKSTGLPIGDYVVKEVSAPNGYTLNTNEYEFSVTKDDDQKLFLVGDKKTNTIVDIKDDNFEGAGLKLFKRDKNGNPLVGAKFKIYKKGDIANAKTYITDSNGKIETGLTELIKGETYVIEETDAPNGFRKANPIEVTVDDQYVGNYIVETITDEAKTGSVNISATKKLIGSDGKAKQLANGQFTFGLYDSDSDDANPIKGSDGKAITATNDKDGNINFTNIPVNPNGSDSVTYYIKEIKPDESDSKYDSNIDYDTHSEKVTISVADNRSDTLVCTPNYDSNGAVFTNTEKVTYNYDGKLTIKKNVSGYPISSNDKFSFKVFITSPIVDLVDKLRKNNTDTLKDNDFKVLINDKNDETDSFIKSLVKTGTDKNNLTTYVAKIQLKKDDVCKITGLPTQSEKLATPTFKIVEDEYTYYDTTSAVENGTKTEANGRTVTGDITPTNTEITYTNHGKFIVPTSADTFTRSPFWIAIALGALVVIYIKMRKKKLNNK